MGEAAVGSRALTVARGIVLLGIVEEAWRSARVSRTSGSKASKKPVERSAWTGMPAWEETREAK